MQTATKMAARRSMQSPDANPLCQKCDSAQS
jgi:hypothetical protein